MKERKQERNIIKQAEIAYLRSKINLQAADLIATDKQLIVEPRITSLGGLGLLGNIISYRVESKKKGFALDFAHITSIERVKHGRNNNIMKIVDNSDNEYRLLIDNYDEWELFIKSRI